MAPTLSKDILFTYFSGDATSLQKKLIAQWLQEAENCELYYEWLEEWERTQPHFLPNTDLAWKENKERIDGSVSELKTSTWPARTVPKTNFLRIGWKVAACLVGVALGFYALRDPIMYHHYKTAHGEELTITLDDSSRVVLNANSTLQVPRWGFGLRHRNVFLDGKAEFVVRKTSDHKKFIVHTPEQSKVTVLGTEFIVHTHKKATQVVLSKGKVQLTSPNLAQPPLTLSPGDLANISQNGKIEVKKLTQKQLYALTARGDHRFIFNRTPLSEVGYRLHEAFGVPILISDSLLSSRVLTGTFNAQNLDEFLAVLPDMLDIDIVRQDDKVIFSPKRTSEF